MGQTRVEKVQELIKQEVSKIILQELKDPRIGFVTVTKVKCSPDLREARIFVSLMGEQSKMEESLDGLKSSLGFIRHEIGRQVRLRYTPIIRFEIDRSLAYSAHIQELLMKVEKEEQETDEGKEV